MHQTSGARGCVGAGTGVGSSLECDIPNPLCHIIGRLIVTEQMKTDKLLKQLSQMSAFLLSLVCVLYKCNNKIWVILFSSVKLI